MSNPRVSFVATSRNDDHGGDVLRRTQTFINRLAEQCNRHGVSAELILVEWNPPMQRGSLAEVLAWPRGSEWFTARIVTVPREIHLAHRHGGRLALFQMIGKNVGIRRARGDHVVATNIDILFSDELFEWLQRGNFQERVLYRSDRWDIPNEIQLEPDLGLLLNRAREEAIRHNRKDGTYVKRGDSFINSTPDRFEDAFYNPLKHCLVNFRELLTQESPGLREQLVSSLDTILGEDLPRLRRNFSIPLLHTNGCGDFTMLSRGDWFRLRGYPEWHIFSWTIDSILIFQAYYNGIKIQELSQDCVHYHIEHDHGSGWTPEGAGNLWARLDERGIPYMSYKQYTNLVYELQDNAERNLFTLYNGLQWGLAAYSLEDRVVVAEDSPARPARQVNTELLTENFFAQLVPVESGLPIEQVFRQTEGVSVSVGGNPTELLVKTREERWSYAIEVGLGKDIAGREHWLGLEVAVDIGRIGIGLLNFQCTDFEYEKFIDGPTAGWENLTIFIPDISAVGGLVFRNATENGHAAQFRLRPLKLFAEPNAGIEEFPLVGPRPTTGANEHAYETAPLEVSLGAGVLAVRSGHPKALICALGEFYGGPKPSSASQQLLVVTPPEHGACGARIELPKKLGLAKLSLDLHVIGGIAGIGFCSRSTEELLSESRIDNKVPLTKVELSVEDAKDIDGFAIRNMSSTEPSKVLIHRIEYE